MDFLYTARPAKARGKKRIYHRGHEEHEGKRRDGKTLPFLCVLRAVVQLI